MISTQINDSSESLMLPPLASDEANIKYGQLIVFLNSILFGEKKRIETIKDAAFDILFSPFPEEIRSLMRQRAELIILKREKLSKEIRNEIFLDNQETILTYFKIYQKGDDFIEKETTSLDIFSLFFNQLNEIYEAIDQAINAENLKTSITENITDVLLANILFFHLKEIFTFYNNVSLDTHVRLEMKCLFDHIEENIETLNKGNTKSTAMDVDDNSFTSTTEKASPVSMEIDEDNNHQKNSSSLSASFFSNNWTSSSSLSSSLSLSLSSSSHSFLAFLPRKKGHITVIDPLLPQQPGQEQGNSMQY